MGCSSTVDELLPGGRVEDPGRLLIDSNVEFVDADDARVEALDPPAEFGTLSQASGGKTFVVLQPQNCDALPDVRVAVVAGALEIEIKEEDSDEKCGDHQLVYIELTLAADFNRHSIVHR